MSSRCSPVSGCQPDSGCGMFGMGVKTLKGSSMYIFPESPDLLQCPAVSQMAAVVYLVLRSETLNLHVCG